MSGGGYPCQRSDVDACLEISKGKSMAGAVGRQTTFFNEACAGGRRECEFGIPNGIGGIFHTAGFMAIGEMTTVRDYGLCYARCIMCDAYGGFVGRLDRCLKQETVAVICIINRDI